MVQTWGKFNIIHSDKIPDPSSISFYLNDYFETAENQADSEEADNYGSIKVPTKFSFWMIIVNGRLYVLNSRRSINQRVISSLDIS